MNRKVELAGKRIGRLLVLREDGRAPKSGAVLWFCQCDCGNTCVVRGANLTSEMTTSCGCLHKELLSARATTHGRTNDPLYNVWKGMRHRCNNKNDDHYHLYGGRGIAVCERWNNFENFLKDMGPRPNSNYSIDRINNDGNYEPNNCRWATITEQARNQTNRKHITSPVKGVSWHKKSKKYIAQIGVNGHPKYIGIFPTIEAAAEARRLAEIKYWGKTL